MRIVSAMVLVLATLAYGRVAVLYLVDPISAAAENDITLASGKAIASVRVVFGGMHLGIALIMLLGLVMPSRRTISYAAALTMTGTIVGVRLATIALDRTASETLFALAIETVVLLSLGIGAWANAAVSAAINSGRRE